ncbi:hypothetical protein ABTL54_20905, partial [Acinetobacter baumannii]
GFILNAKIRLQRTPSAFIQQTSIKTRDLSATLDALMANANSPYSVAWIDCLAPSQQLGRGLVLLGEPAIDAGFTLK